MKHLEEIGETYWEHFLFAIRFGFVLFVAGILVMIHAFFPNFMSHVGSDVVKHAYAILKEREGKDDE